MADIKAFSFYKSYFDCLEDLEDKDRNEVLNAILNYVFKDKKPKFKGIKKTIWTLIEPNLNTSKNRSNGNSGAPIGNQNARKYKENEEKNETIKKQSKNNQNLINDIKDISYSLSLSLSNSLSYSKSKIINNNILNNLFIEYLKVREKKEYVINEVVIQELLEKLDNVETDSEKEEMLKQAIIGGWKDFYPVSEKGKTNKQTKRVL